MIQIITLKAFIVWLKRNWYYWLAAGAVLFLFIVVFNWAFCGGEKTIEIDEEKLRKEREAIEQRERERLDNSLNKITVPLENINRKIREAQENTNRATNRDYLNKNNQELANELVNRLRKQ